MTDSWKTFKISMKFDKLSEIEITAVSGGSGQVVFGDSTGHLHYMNNRYQLEKHPAFELCVTNLYQLKQHNVLISAGKDEEGNSPLIKVWEFEKDKLGSLICARTIRVNTGKEVPSISCLSAHENMNMIAVGTHQGIVNLIPGNLTKDRSSEQRVIDTGSSPVTGLGFKQVGQSILLYVSTSEQILSYMLTDQDALLSVLDTPGCKFNCSTMSDHTQDFRFVVGRNEAVYLYTPGEKSQCLPFEGEKKLLRWFRGYLVVVSAASMADEEQRESVNLSIYDINNSIVIFTETFHFGIIDVVEEWGSLFVITRDHKLIIPKEHDMPSKPQDTSAKRFRKLRELSNNKKLLIAGGVVAGVGVGAVGIVGATIAGALLAPIVLPALGFTSAGIALGSIAAAIQGPAVAAGSAFAIAQSTGALGAGACALAGAQAGAVIGATGVGVGAAGAAGYGVAKHFSKIEQNQTNYLSITIISIFE